MSKLKIFYLLSLVSLAVLIAITVFRPVAKSGEYSVVARESLLEMDNEWIIQLDIANREGHDTKYNINVALADKQYSEQFLVQNGRIYSYIHHIRRDTADFGRATVTVYKESSDTPFEQAIYYLK